MARIVQLLYLSAMGKFESQSDKLSLTGTTSQELDLIYLAESKIIQC